MLYLGEMKETMVHMHLFIGADYTNGYHGSIIHITAIKECKRLFDFAFKTRADDFDGPSLNEAERPLSDTSSGKILSEDLQRLTKSRTGIVRAHLKYNTMFFSSSSAHLGNSLVQFYLHGNTAVSSVPGQIQNIIWIKDKPSFVICRHLSASGVDTSFEKYTHFQQRYTAQSYL